ncbi:MAG TPA: DEAD/DEAH box helicase, partial [Acidimicrobiales bacterium]|nr:DEAD/DEAH box helicase [Acidimicrobiales bacterium]
MISRSETGTPELPHLGPGARCSTNDPSGALLNSPVADWFSNSFPLGPSEPQLQGWPAIRAGGDVLIASPTGTGKTLTGFLMAIDNLCFSPAMPRQLDDQTRKATSIVYVSPLKALAVDVSENLDRPLREIAQLAAEMGINIPDIAVGVRTGDTTSKLRAAMVKSPPDILVTTPESLYLLLTSEKGRQTLTQVSTVIIDEIHALARDKRGSHLSLTLERLDSIQSGPRP